MRIWPYPMTLAEAKEFDRQGLLKDWLAQTEEGLYNPREWRTTLGPPPVYVERKPQWIRDLEWKIGPDIDGLSALQNLVRRRYGVTYREAA